MSSPAAAGAYRFASHVRACQLGRHVVLLDLKAGRYLGLSRQGAAVDEDGQSGDAWPAVVGGTSVSLDDLACAGIEPLVHAGLVVADHGTPPRAAVLLEPLSGLHTQLGEVHPPLTVGQVLGVGTSAAAAALWLRYLSLAAIADRVTRLVPPCPCTATDVPRPMRDAVAVYTRARPFAFTAHDRCLLDSLTLMHFLARRGFHAQWVIGVGTRPFRAHSWVQHGHVVLNDAPENVRRHRPILVV